MNTSQISRQRETVLYMFLDAYRAASNLLGIQLMTRNDICSATQMKSGSFRNKSYCYLVMIKVLHNRPLSMLDQKIRAVTLMKNAWGICEVVLSLFLLCVCFFLWLASSTVPCNSSNRKWYRWSFYLGIFFSFLFSSVGGKYIGVADFINTSITIWWFVHSRPIVGAGYDIDFEVSRTAISVIVDISAPIG